MHLRGGGGGGGSGGGGGGSTRSRAAISGASRVGQNPKMCRLTKKGDSPMAPVGGTQPEKVGVPSAKALTCSTPARGQGGAACSTLAARGRAAPRRVPATHVIAQPRVRNKRVCYPRRATLLHTLFVMQPPASKAPTISLSARLSIARLGRPTAILGWTYAINIDGIPLRILARTWEKTKIPHLK